jgi:8-oxo-dGTP pyrophosphatase MutT (NUDIX family)
MNSASQRPNRNERWQRQCDTRAKPKRGVAAVIVQDGCLLLVRRSHLVRSPRLYCFPGGGIEVGEDEPTALLRELREELAVDAVLKQRLWQSVTPWGVELAWWQADLLPGSTPTHNPAEVESWHWSTLADMRANSDLLPSNLAFLDAWQQRVFTLEGIESPSEAP